uniref:Uncharacterized protein n=1 Tax=Anguilla anguilla TaxID=7936 RepID=A0A0E9XPC2_ANGAN
MFKDNHLGFANFTEVDVVTATHFVRGGGCQSGKCNSS